MPEAPPCRLVCPQLGLEPARTPSGLLDAAVAHFGTIPWCAELLASSSSSFPASSSPPSSPSSSSPPSSSTSSDPAAPALILFVPQCLNPDPDDGRADQFLGLTLARSPGRPLRHMLCFFRPDDPAHLRDPTRPVRRLSALCALGPGLAGYPGLLHGGVAAALLDEAQAILHELNAALGKSLLPASHPLASPAAAQDAATVTLTADLAVRYRRPIPSEGVLYLSAWIEAASRRRADMACAISNSHGEVLASAKGTWITIKASM